MSALIGTGLKSTGLSASLKRALFCFGVVLLPLLGLSEEGPWKEIRGPHFRLITNGRERAGRHVVREFEQMRAVFAMRFPQFRLDSAEPLLIVAPEDESSAKKLLPEFWKHAGPKPAGVYFHSWEQPYALVRLDTVDVDSPLSNPFAVVYHEYVHSLLHLNLHWLPTWLDEGLAQFYAYTRFEGKYTLIGAPPRSLRGMAILRNRSIPLAKFIDQRGSFTKSEEDTELFYEQSWALTHYLTMSPGMDGGARLNKFFAAIQQGVDQKKAFQDTFGDFATVQKNFDQYVRLFAFAAGQIPSPARIEDKDLAARSLSLAETNAEIACFYAATHQWKLAQQSSELALKNDSKLALAHQEMGFVLLQEGKDDEALKEFSESINLDRRMYRAVFARTMLSNLPHSANPADQLSFRSELMAVINTNPQFAPAFVELAKLDVALGDPARALGLALKAEKLEPWRAGYHLLTGQILLRTGRPADAAANAAYVAEHWPSPDHDEAMELWNLVPPEKRPAEAPRDMEKGKDVSRAEGIVKSVECGENQGAIVLETSGQPDRAFNIRHSSGGFSDTLWFGEDHFNTCHHTTGLRAVIFYKASTDPPYAGEAVSYGFRDDLPPAPAGAVNNARSQ
jgi:predicted negative regulator of RcsB-dependent stress response